MEGPSTQGPVILYSNILRHATRAQACQTMSPRVIGYDSTQKKKLLPEQWTLVDDWNMEGRKHNAVRFQRLIILKEH